MNILPEQKIIVNRKTEEINRQFLKAMDASFLGSVDSTFDLQARIKKDFCVDIASNQFDLIEAIVDLNEKNVTETDARSGGKTFATGIGLALVSLDVPRVGIGITAPTDGQAGRLINDFKTKVVPCSQYLKDKIDWRMTTAMRVVFKNGSVWEAFSGNELSAGESRHSDILVVDESQDVTDFAMSNMLLPMIQSSKIAKVIKIGVPRGKNHFHRSAISKEGIYLVHDWLHCPNLHNAGTFEFNGVKYPKTVLDKMPYAVWQRYFPNNPELWRDPPNAMSDEDFETQEEMKWLLDANLFLDEKEQMQLIGDFRFDHLETEEYFFGFDIAGGKFIKKGKKNDRTSLSIGRVRNGVKQKVFGWSAQGDAIDQMDELLSFIHPNYGKFHCKFGLGDYGYNPMMIDALIKAGVNMEPIQFGSRDQNTGKNNKNMLYESFKFELQADRFKYPCKEFINRDKELKNGFNQWCILEERRGKGINSVIEAPSGFHDDVPSSDILLNRAMMTKPSQQTAKKKEHQFPQLIQGISTTVGIKRTMEKDENSPFSGGLINM